MKDSFAKQYEKLEQEHYWHQARREIVDEALRNYVDSAEQPLKILDVGCGTGTYAKHLASETEYIGVETNPYLTARARAKGVHIIEQAMPSKLDLPERHFDAILLLDVLEHIQDDVGTLESLLPLLKQDGRFIINVPAHPVLWSLLDEVNEHKRRYTKKVLVDRVKKVNLKPIVTRYWASGAASFALLQRRLWWQTRSLKTYQTHIPSPVINNLMKKYLVNEWHLTRHLPLPFGVSIFMVSGKQPEKAEDRA